MSYRADPGGGRPISLLVHIAFHFVPHRWRYLERVLTGLCEFAVDRLLIVVDSNTNDVSHLLNGLRFPEHCHVRVDVHTSLSHPFRLTWAHRSHMASVLNSFEYFMYLEDDIYVPPETFNAWLRRSGSLSRRDFVHGFLRVENDYAGRPMASDWRTPAKRPAVFEIDGIRYIRPTWFYQACWLYSRETMRRFVETEAWTSGLHRWSSVIRAHRESGSWSYAREFSAFGIACATPGRPRVLLPVGDDGQILSDAWVWHLPNNYAQGSEIALLDARQLVEGGLGRDEFGIIDSAAEVGKWASYLLRVDEVRQFARGHIRRLLR